MRRPSRNLWLMVAVAVLAVSSPAALADNALVTAAVNALKAGDATQAENLATQAIAIGALSREDRARMLLNRGLAREQLQRPRDALVDFNAAFDLDVLQAEEKARALFDRGVAYDELGATELAVADYSAALKLTPDFPAALNNRANVYRRTGYLEDAKHDYQASLNAKNTRPEFPYYGLGQIAEAQKDLAAARDWYGKAVAANAGYALASQRLAALGGAAPTLRGAATVVADAAPPVPQPPKPVETKLDAQAAPQPVLAEAKVAAPAEAKPQVSKPVETVADNKSTAVAPTLTPAAYAPPQAESSTLRPAIVEAVANTNAAPATAAASTPGAKLIQLGAWRGEAEAAAGWNQIVARSGKLLEGMTPQIVMADVPGKGRFYRLRSAPAAGVSPSTLCTRLQSQSLACMAVK
ncbi:MAG TPA: tetratricopeptide repeat protein [Rhizomicrobium sp.]|jgi:tetratricopeptide (TPR) repeat protein|nr:tetratricopeptide repeat protein [Rhizomicrobium sp.]